MKDTNRSLDEGLTEHLLSLCKRLELYSRIRKNVLMCNRHQENGRSRFYTPLSSFYFWDNAISKPAQTNLTCRNRCVLASCLRFFLCSPLGSSGSPTFHKSALNKININLIDGLTKHLHEGDLGFVPLVNPLDLDDYLRNSTVCFSVLHASV